MQDMYINYLCILYMYYHNRKYAWERYIASSELLEVSLRTQQGKREKGEIHRRAGAFNCICNILLLFKNVTSMADVLVPNRFT